MKTDAIEKLYEKFLENEAEKEKTIQSLKPVVREIEEAVVGTIGNDTCFQIVEKVLSDLDTIHIQTYYDVKYGTTLDVSFSLTSANHEPNVFAYDCWDEIYKYYQQIMYILTMNLQSIVSYCTFMKLRSKVILIFRKLCDEVGCMNRFEYYGDLMMIKTDERLRFEIEARDEIKERGSGNAGDNWDDIRKQWESYIKFFLSDK